MSTVGDEREVGNGFPHWESAVRQAHRWPQTRMTLLSHSPWDPWELGSDPEDLSTLKGEAAHPKSQ